MSKKPKQSVTIEGTIEDLTQKVSRKFSKTPNQSVSLLLGAGFSAPMGYPIGNQLNEALLNCTGDDFAFHTSGILVTRKGGSKPDWGYKTSDDYVFDFCRDLMAHFNQAKGYFDYEEFYDFFKSEASDDPEVQIMFNTNTYHGWKSLKQILFQIIRIYNQLVAHYLVDRHGKSWYDDEGHICGPIWPGYTGILNCLSQLGAKNIVNIHTLNHDLFFERLNISDWINGKLCDGFTELGSPFYGLLDINGRAYKCRLQYYTGEYDKRFRLYKLHGSKDYGLYYRSEGSKAIPDVYIKTRYGIGFGEFLREITNENGRLDYESCLVNYHADFLTGTTSKIERYAELLLFKNLFELFRSNLRDAEQLIIIGYGGRDSEINKMILENFDFKKKPSFIIDPDPGEAIKNLRSKIGAKLITTQLEGVTMEELSTS